MSPIERTSQEQGAGTELVSIASPDDIASLPVEQRGQLITNALVESRKWLAVATKNTDPTPIQEFKAWAATVAEMTRQKGLSQEIQMDAQEMVRRAERGIGLVVQQGQETGAVRKAGERDVYGNRHGSRATTNVNSSSPRDFYVNNREYVDARDMTVGVSDEAFEDAITDAREAGNLSRRAVATRSRERSGREVVPRDTRPAETAPPIPVNPAPPRRPDAPTGISPRSPKRHRFVTAAAMDHLGSALDALTVVLDTAIDGLDPAITHEQAAQWVSGLSRRHKAYSRVVALLKQRSEDTQ